MGAAKPIRLKYLKGSKEVNAWMEDAEDRRMWNILTPVPNYKHIPTVSLKTLRLLGIVPNQKGMA